MAIPASLRRHAQKIMDVYRHPDGSWDIALAYGWFCTATETHGIIENTLRACLVKFASVVPCHCEDCVKHLAKRKETK